MATTYHNDLQKLYVAYFNRPADPGGLAHYEGVLERAFTAGGAAEVSKTMALISADFAKSNEYQTTYNQATNSAVVTAVYQNLFGHAPDSTGLAFYVKALTDKSMTVDTMVTYIANGAQGTDKVAYDSKVTVATAFTNALNTPEEIAGYNVTASQTYVKNMLAGIKTAAQATAAIAPTALDASVAASIKAGIPFTLNTGLANLDLANKAVADFLANVEIDLDGDDEADENVTPANIATNVINAQGEVATLVGGTAYAGAADSVKAAIVAQKLVDLEDALEAEQAALTTAVTAMNAKSGLGNAVAASTSAAEASKLAAADLVLADNALAGAKAVVQLNELIRVNGNGSVDLMKLDEDEELVLDKPLAVLKDGDIVLATGVTATQAATYNGLTAYITAANAQPDAAVAAQDAEDAALLAQARVEVIDLSAASAVATTGNLAVLANAFAGGPVTPAAAGKPTADEIAAQLNGLKLLAIDAREKANLDSSLEAAAVTAEGKVETFRTAVEKFNTDNVTTLATNVTTAEGKVEVAQGNFDDMTDAVAALEDAQALAAELKSLDAAVTAAKKEFTDNKFKAPAEVGSLSNFGTSGNDIFVAKTGVAAATITSFGLQGDDVLYVGSGYTYNSGKLADGNDSVLEVFFTQKGSSTVVTIETKAYGSDSGVDVQTITLTGVDATDLTFANGIISI